MNLPRRCAAVIRTLVAVSGLAVAIAPLGFSSSAMAQESVRATDFGGVRFPLDATTGELSFAATRAYSSTTNDTQRLVLIGDVRVRIGRYDFHAKRASAWIAPVAGSGGALQVYVFFEDLGRSDELATAAGFAADKLPVKAIIVPDGGGTLTADVVLDRLPSGSDPAEHQKFVERSEAALARSLGLAPPPVISAPKPILDSEFVARRENERVAWLAAGKPDLSTLPPLPVRASAFAAASEDDGSQGPNQAGTRQAP
ncbi:MAG: hypothetical protein PSX37_10880, partial [bacterium]|nr:hypothetical protein [bacterium]